MEVALAVLVAWVILSAAIEAAAWRAERLGRRAAPACFRAPPVTGAPARIAFVGDMQRGVAGVARPLAQALRERTPSLLVSSGDLVAHGEAPYYGIVLDAFDRAGVETPVRAVPGNHDLYPRGVRDAGLGGGLFERRLGPRRWAERVGPVLVVGIDDAVAPWPKDAHAWLASTLDAHPEVPWIAVCHRPPRNVDEADARAEPDLAELVRLLESRPPLLVVCGHKHESIEREVAGVLYVVNARGGDLPGPLELLHVEVDASGAARREVTRHARRLSLRVLFHQACVRLWSLRRRPSGLLLSAPAALLLSLLRLRAPVRRPDLPLQN
jgi:hypothetical protein